MKLSTKQNLVSIGSIFAILTLSYIFMYSQLNNYFTRHIYQNIENEITIIKNELNSNLEQQKNNSSSQIFDENTYITIKKNINNKKFFADGYPFIINNKGDLLIHPTLETKNIGNYDFGSKIIESGIKSGDFEYFSAYDGAQMILSFSYYSPYNIYICYVAEKKKAEMFISNFNNQFLTILFICFIIISVVIFYLNKSIINIITEIYYTVKNYSINNFKNTITKTKYEEVEKISDCFEKIKDNYETVDNYAQKIGKNDFDFTINKDSGSLSMNLVKIKENIELAKQEAESRKEEDEKQKWINQGLAQFSDVLRQNTEDIQKHSDVVIQNIVKYVNANQGALFLVESEDGQEAMLKLVSAFAYETKKYISKTIPLGEGLIGTCAIEKNTVYLSEIPENYITITSGLGEAPPNYLLIVPIKRDNEILGVIEIASFYNLEQYKISFVEKIMESVASTLASAQINNQTKELLRKFESQSKEMSEKEEEMEQTIEELQATQEETAIREFEFQSIISTFTNNCFFVQYNVKGGITDVNSKYLDILGYTKTIIKTKTVFDGIIKDEDADKLKALWEGIKDGKSCNFSTSYLTNNEEIIDVSEVFCPIQSKQGSVDKIIKIVTIKNKTK
jgi:methyl-accepting chemotaxis protein